MALLLHWKIFLTSLRKLRFAGDYTKRCLGRLALFFAFLGRKFSKWWHSRPGKPGSCQTLKPADPPFRCTEANSYSVSGGPAIAKRYTVAASSVPASASLPSLHDPVERQPATAAAPTVDAIGTPPPAEDSHGHNPLHPLGGRGLANLSSGNLSAASRASDRFSIITASRDSLRATQDQPPRVIRGVHRQVLRGPDPSQSKGQATPSPSPEIITTNLPSLDREIRRELSPTSGFVVDVQNPSTAHSTPGFPVVGQHDRPLPGLPMSSNAATTLNCHLPEGRFVQPVNSEKTLRYNRAALMQVEYTIISRHPYISLQTSRGDTI